MALGFNQVKDFDFDDTYAPVPHLEFINMLLVFSALKVFFYIKWMLNSFIKKDVYVEQPSVFEHIDFPNHIFKLKRCYMV